MAKKKTVSKETTKKISKEDQAKIKEAKRYQEFLKDNGCTMEQRHLFTRVIDKDKGEIVLYKEHVKTRDKIVYKRVAVLEFLNIK